jgi:hypothetical protein
MAWYSMIREGACFPKMTVISIKVHGIISHARVGAYRSLWEKKNSYEHVCNSKRLPRQRCVNLKTQKHCKRLWRERNYC